MKRRTGWANRGVKSGCAALALVGTLAPAPIAAAKPQFAASLTPALCSRSTDARGLCFHGSARADVLFLRERSSDFAVGPVLELGTVNFEAPRVSAGISWLVPFDPLPVVLSAAPLVRLGAAPSAGGSARVFWGIRGYNHSGSYSAAGGILLGFDQLLGANSEQVWHVGLQLDAMWLSLPALLLVGWARGPSD